MSDISQEISEFGQTIFKAIGDAQPSSFNKNYWSGRIMEWAMTRPDFKLNMFRLVDVLPSLKDSQAIARHVNEYLGTVAKEMNWLFRWGLNMRTDSWRAKFTARCVNYAVRNMAAQFIAGENARAALGPLKRIRRRGLAFTVDLLGEFSVSEREATQYLERYMEALGTLGREFKSGTKSVMPGHPGEQSANCISVKLTALYSQVNVLNSERSLRILSDRLAAIAARAKELGALLYVDAEDTASNQIIYKVFCEVFSSKEFKDFPIPGIVLQAYQFAADEILEKLLELGKSRGAPIAVRLVKGAYWDHETILSQQNGWPSPLFSHKQSSDANYERLSRKLIDNYQLAMPAFGSHNVRSLSHACIYAKQKGLGPKDFELQMLYGMADPIADAFKNSGYLVRLYVPLGETLPGMGYLVRRLLENTSNESFLRHSFFDEDDFDQLMKEPIFSEESASV